MEFTSPIDLLDAASFTKFLGELGPSNEDLRLTPGAIKHIAAARAVLESKLVAADAKSQHVSSAAASLARQQLTGKNTCVLSWQPDFGAALLAVQLDSFREMRLFIIGLDGWTFDSVGISNDKRKRNAAIPSFKPLVLNVGDCVSVDQCDDLIVQFEQLIKEASGRRKDRRHPDNEDGGVQRTPAFMKEVVWRALQGIRDQQPQQQQQHPRTTPEATQEEEEGYKYTPKGGTTDVGRHTGGAKRDCLLPLHIAVLHFLLCNNYEQPEELLEYIILGFDAWGLRKPKWYHDTLTPKQCLDVAQRLRCISQRALNVRSYWIEGIVSKCRDVQQNVQSLLLAFGAFKAKRYTLDPQNQIHASALKSPQLWPAKQVPKTTLSPACKDELYKLAKSNLQLTNHIGYGFTFQQAVDFLAAFDGKDAFALYVAQVETERLVFQFALALATLAKQDLLSTESILGDSQNLTGLFLLHERYTSNMKKLDLHSAAPRVDLPLGIVRSRWILFDWCVFCLVHQHVAIDVEELFDFKCALRREDLPRLVLDDKCSEDVLLAVVGYLASFEGCSDEFALRSSKTDEKCSNWMSFAEEVTAGSQAKFYTQRLRERRTVDDERKQALWQQIQASKTKLAELQRSLTALNEEYNRRDSCDIPEHAARENCKCNTAKDIISQRRKIGKEINHLEKEIFPILTPELPKLDQEALCVLFFEFRHPPAIFALYDIACRVVETLHTLAQLPPQAKKKSECPEPARADEFVLIVGKSAGLGVKGPFFRAQFLRKPSKVATWWLGSGLSLASITDIDDCIRYPTEFELRVRWGSNLLNFDGINCAHLEDLFCEQLADADFKALDWAVRLPIHQDPDYARGNKGQQCVHAPDYAAARKFLMQQQFLTLASMRASELQQMTKLVACIRERSLPFDVDAVQIIMRQVMFDAGPVHIDSESGVVIRPWKSELLAANSELASDLKREISKFAHDKKNSPRSWKEIMLMTQLSAYMAGHCSHFREVTTELRKMMMRWAEELTPQIVKSCDENAAEKRNSLCELKRTYLAIAIQSFGMAPFDLDTEAARDLLCCLVGFYHSQSSQQQAALSILFFKARIVAAIHIPSVKMELRDRESEILGPAIRQVFPDFTLTCGWNCYSPMDYGMNYPNPTHYDRYDDSSDNSDLFDAVWDGRLVSINVMTGCVLLNGRPPSALPPSVVNHFKYARAFGQNNFTTTVDSLGRFETVHAIKGCKYSFHELSSSKNLQVFELPVQTKGSWVKQLELLDLCDSLEQPNEWCKELGARMCSMHSAWVTDCPSDPNSDVVFFRGRAFDDRAVKFVAIVRKSSLLSLDHTELFEVPQELQLEPLSSLFESAANKKFNRVIQANFDLQKVIQTLSKIEDAAFVVCVLTPANLVCLKLPRMRLDFELRGSRWHSLQQKHFVLAHQQQFADTLIWFHQYLILEMMEEHEAAFVQNPTTIVLLPQAKIVSHPSRPGCVICDVSSVPPDGTINLYKFKLHHRFKTLQASCFVFHP